MKSVRGKIDGKIIAEKLKQAIGSFSTEKEEEKSGADDIEEVMEEILSNDEAILREKGVDAYNILFIKLKKRLKGQIDETELSDKLKNAINVFLEKW
jgi:Glu-tRNA(Gln) amidotransferase subunit E-like FAD-binding protein